MKESSERVFRLLKLLGHFICKEGDDIIGFSEERSKLATGSLNAVL